MHELKNLSVNGVKINTSINLADRKHTIINFQFAQLVHTIQSPSFFYPGFPRWRCVFLTVAVKYDIKINAVLTI